MTVQGISLPGIQPAVSLRQGAFSKAQRASGNGAAFSVVTFSGEEHPDRTVNHANTTVLNPDPGVLKAKGAILMALRLPPQPKNWKTQLSEILRDNFWPFGAKRTPEKLAGNIGPGDVQVVYPSRFQSPQANAYPHQGVAITVPSTADEIQVVETLQKKLGYFLPAAGMPKGCYRYFETPVEILVRTDRPG